MAAIVPRFWLLANRFPKQPCVGVVQCGCDGRFRTVAVADRARAGLAVVRTSTASMRQASSAHRNSRTKRCGFPQRRHFSFRWRWLLLLLLYRSIDSHIPVVRAEGAIFHPKQPGPVASGGRTIVFARTSTQCTKQLSLQCYSRDDKAAPTVPVAVVIKRTTRLVLTFFTPFSGR